MTKTSKPAEAPANVRSHTGTVVHQGTWKFVNGIWQSTPICRPAAFSNSVATGYPTSKAVSCKRCLGSVAIKHGETPEDAKARKAAEKVVHNESIKAARAFALVRQIAFMNEVVARPGAVNQDAVAELAELQARLAAL